METTIITILVTAYCLACSLAGLHTALRGWLKTEGIWVIALGAISTVSLAVATPIYWPYIEHFIVAMLLIQIGAIYIAGQNFRKEQGTDYIEIFKNHLKENPVFTGTMTGRWWK